MLVTVLRAAGFRVIIHSNDHEPAHVHVWHGNGEARIQLAPTRAAPVLVRHVGMNASVRRAAVRLVIEHREQLLQAWQRIHGEARS